MPHPGLSIGLFGPGKHMPGELFFWYVPARAVLVFTQPVGNLLRSLLVVDFGDDERALLRKKLRSPAQDLVLTTLHVDLDQFWGSFAGGNKVVEPDCSYVYDWTASQDGAVSISFHATLRFHGCATAKGNSITRGARPYSGVHYSQAISQPIPRSMVPQTRDVFGITIESYNTTRVAHKPSCPESHSSQMGANVIDNRARPNYS